MQFLICIFIILLATAGTPTLLCSDGSGSACTMAEGENPTSCQWQYKFSYCWGITSIWETNDRGFWDILICVGVPQVLSEPSSLGLCGNVVRGLFCSGLCLLLVPQNGPWYVLVSMAHGIYPWRPLHYMYCSHTEVNLFWAAHQVHHSSQDYTLSTALRQSVLQRFTSWVSCNTMQPLCIEAVPVDYILHSFSTYLWHWQFPPQRTLYTSSLTCSTSFWFTQR